MNRSFGQRGIALMETVVAMATGAVLLTMVMRVAVTGTQSFNREQGQSYTQFRSRTALDAMAVDLRSACNLITPSGLPSNDAALVMEVPCKSATGIVYSGATMLKDTVAYWHSTDGVLHRTTVRGDASSQRTAGTISLAQNVTGISFTLKDDDGVVITDVTKVAVVDVSATVASTVGMTPSTVALTSVRLRNKRLATGISGYLAADMTSGSSTYSKSVSGTQVTATSTTDSTNTQTVTVGAAVVNPAHVNDGTPQSYQANAFSFSGLTPGTYSVKATYGAKSQTLSTSITVTADNVTEMAYTQLPYSWN